MILTALASVITHCGGAKPGARPQRPDGVSGATETFSSDKYSGDPTTGEASPATVHVCKKPIEAPGDVWPRIEAIRVLDKQEFTEKCDLSLVDVFSKWRCLPPDLLGPLVERASADDDGLVDWVKERIESDPAGAACVVAMDVIGSFKVGADPDVVARRAKTWEQVAQESEEIAAALEPVESLGAMLVEDVKLTSCKGETCKRLKKTAQILKKRYLGLVEKIEKVPVEIYREQMKAWLVLPPFKSQA